VAARSGCDPLGREHLANLISTAPYFAVLVQACSVISFGGLVVDEQLRVLDGSGRPVAGLYAAGEIIGAAATSGNAFAGGMTVTPALSLGRILGRRLAAAAHREAAVGGHLR
jgi:predicted oxidoreductase